MRTTISKTDADVKSVDRDSVINLIAELFIKLTNSTTADMSLQYNMPVGDPLFQILEKMRQDIAELKKSVLPDKNLLSAQEAAKYLSMSISTLYKLTASMEIPHSKPTGRSLYFDRDEITQWAMGKKCKNPRDEADKILQSRQKHKL